MGGMANEKEWGLVYVVRQEMSSMRRTTYLVLYTIPLFRIPNLCQTSSIYRTRYPRKSVGHRGLATGIEGTEMRFKHGRYLAAVHSLVHRFRV